MRKLLVTFFGLGYGPVAPGTWGSAGAVALYLALFFAMGAVPWWLLLALIAAACAVNLACGRWAVAHYASTDPKPMVIDEVAGMWVSLLFVPVGSGVRALVVCAAAFFLFRIFDILKLPPARQLERLPHGAGILCDDLAAGVQTNVLLQIGLVLWGMLSADAQSGVALGLVQGVTEFLPVSSSGHLALGRALLDNPMLRESPLLFDVSVHAATLLAIVVYFRVEVWRLIRGGVFTLLSVSKRFRPHPDSRPALDRRLFLCVVVASVPTAVAGLLLRDTVEGALQHPVPVGLLLCITGILLFVTRGFRGEGKTLGELTALDALVVGVAQGFAVLPGISRSGSTIATGIVLGVDRRSAARFSFLIAVPAIAGAAALELPELFAQPAGGLLVPALLGALAAFLSGYAAIVLLVRLLEKRLFAWFAPYCWLVGLAAIVLGLLYGS